MNGLFSHTAHHKRGSPGTPMSCIPFKGFFSAPCLLPDISLHVSLWPYQYIYFCHYFGFFNVDGVVKTLHVQDWRPFDVTWAKMRQVEKSGYQSNAPKKVQENSQNTHISDVSRASRIIDALETSIIYSAPFAAGFLKIILSFSKCQDAPFRASFSRMITYKLIRKKVKL